MPKKAKRGHAWQILGFEKKFGASLKATGKRSSTGGPANRLPTPPEGEGPLGILLAKSGLVAMQLPPRGNANPQSIVWLDGTSRTASPPAHCFLQHQLLTQLATGDFGGGGPSGGEGGLGARAIHQPLSPEAAGVAGAGAAGVVAGAANAANVEEWGEVRRYPPGTTAGAVGDGKGKRPLLAWVLCRV